MVHLGVDYVPDGQPAIHVHGPNRVGVEILSKVDPSAAPEGHATVALIRLVRNDEARAWFPATKSEDWKTYRLSNAYSEHKRELADAMVAAAEAVLPDLSKHIVHRSEASPITYARYDHTSAGAIYGVARSGRMRGEKSPIPGLVIAGAATHGPGVEAVVISGARAAEALVPGLLAQGAKADVTPGRRQVEAGRPHPEPVEGEPGLLSSRRLGNPASRLVAPPLDVWRRP